MASLFDAARACLDAATPEDKLARTAAAKQAFDDGEFALLDDATGPEPIRMPGRPERPRLVHPRELPRRGFGSNEGRAAFLRASVRSAISQFDHRFRNLILEDDIDYAATGVHACGDRRRA